jgi:hypothetical protein
MRTALNIRRSAPRPAGPKHANRTRARAGALAALASGLLVLALCAPAGALADSMSLSIAQEPVVQELASQVSWTASSEEGTLAVVYVNNPGVPCAADPAGDDGQRITETHLLEGSNVGAFSGSADYAPPSTGTYTACGWLEIPAGLLEVDGGPVTTSTSLAFNVRAPHISLALSFPRRPEPGRRFTLDLNVSSEVQREVVVEGAATHPARLPRQLRRRRSPAPDRSESHGRSHTGQLEHRTAHRRGLHLLRVGGPVGR